MINDKINIEISNTGVVIDKIENGVKVTRNTTVENINQVLSIGESIETPLLPGMWGTQKYVKSGNMEIFVITIPGHVRDVSFDFGDSDSDDDDYESDEKNYRIPVPATCWFIAVEKNSGQYRLRHTVGKAIKNPILRENDEMFKLPFSNCNDTYICWGSSSLQPEFTTSKSIANVPETFFGNHFNNDLGDGKFTQIEWKRDGSDTTIRAFLINHLFDYLDEQLRKDKTFVFPSDKLRRSSDYDTFSDTLRFIKREVGIR